MVDSEDVTFEKIKTQELSLQDTFFRVRVNIRVLNALVFLTSQYALKYKH